MTDPKHVRRDDDQDVLTREEWCAEYPDFAWTWDLDEHPDGHEEPCACLECRIYGVS